MARHRQASIGYSYPFNTGKLELNTRWKDADETGPTNYTVGDDSLLYFETFSVKVAREFRKLSRNDKT